MKALQDGEAAGILTDQASGNGEGLWVASSAARATP
jgi:lauroyl/myristoyl acyltransferase